MAAIAVLSPNQLQHEFSKLIQAVILGVLSTLPTPIHSIYLYGSIAKGCATPFVSDADFSIVLRQALSTNKTHALAQCQTALAIIALHDNACCAVQ